jgi:hypothetical protein
MLSLSSHWPCFILLSVAGRVHHSRAGESRPSSCSCWLSSVEWNYSDEVPLEPDLAFIPILFFFDKYRQGWAYLLSPFRGTDPHSRIPKGLSTDLRLTLQAFVFFSPVYLNDSRGILCTAISCPNFVLNRKRLQRLENFLSLARGSVLYGQHRLITLFRREH